MSYMGSFSGGGRVSTGAELVGGESEKNLKKMMNNEQWPMVGAKTKKPNKRLWEEQYPDPTSNYITSVIVS